MAKKAPPAKKPVRSVPAKPAIAPIARAAKLQPEPRRSAAPPKPAEDAKVVSVPPADDETRAADTRKRSASARVELLPRAFMSDLAVAIRDAVRPAIEAAKGREIVGSAASGDATFQLDKIAEKALLQFLRDAKYPLAYYSEDSGYTTFSSGQPEHLLIVDPIDGTRAAKSGFEGCVVSIGSTSTIERPRLGDIRQACVMEIMGPRTFYAERGKGVKIYADGQYRRPKLSDNTNLETVSWSMTVPARPAELIFPTAAKLIDLTSLKGGFFTCNSTSYSLTRLLTNQLDACVDIANRFLRDIPGVVEDQFINAGRGIVLGIAPYDIAASVLIAQEGGCIVTDAYGNGFDEVLLLDSTVGNHRSLIAAANKTLHDKLLEFFDRRIRQYEHLWQLQYKSQSQ